jgi:hypothetical protein
MKIGFFFAHFNLRRFEIWGANDADNPAGWGGRTSGQSRWNVKASNLLRPAAPGELSDEDGALCPREGICISIEQKIFYPEGVSEVTFYNFYSFYRHTLIHSSLSLLIPAGE